MQDITELQRRLTAALDRIGSGVDRLGRAEAGNAAPAEPRDDAGGAAAIQSELERYRTMFATLEEDRARLKAVNEALRQSSQALRETRAGDGVDAQLLEGAMQAELDALRATQASDRAELNAIIEMLGPVVAGSEAEDHDA